MPYKTYKFVSVCERPKPVQTNNAYQFTWHVAFCKTCLEKLPESILQQLEPRLSQFKSERAEKKLPPEQKPPVEVISSEKKEDVPIKDQPGPPKPKADKKQQSQFDALIEGSPVFQGLAKSVGELKTGLNEQINTLGDMMQKRMEQIFKGISGERGVEEPEKEIVPAETPPPETPPEAAPSGGTAGPGGRPNPFGQPDQLPAAMKDSYKAGDKPPPQLPPSDTPPGGQPPLGEQRPPGEQPPPPDITDKGMPKLRTPEQIGLFKRYLAEEEERLTGEGKAPVKKVDDMLGTAKSSVGLLKEVVDIFRGKGESQPSALTGTPIGEMLQVVKGINDLTMGQFKGMFEMMKAVREGEKLIRTEPSVPRGSSPGKKEPPPEESVSTE